MPANMERQQKRAIRIDGGKEGTSLLYVRHSENCLVKELDAFKVVVGSLVDVRRMQTLQPWHGRRFSEGDALFD